MNSLDIGSKVKIQIYQRAAIDGKWLPSGYFHKGEILHKDGDYYWIQCEDGNKRWARSDAIVTLS